MVKIFNDIINIYFNKLSKLLKKKKYKKRNYFPTIVKNQGHETKEI